jgi:transposase-like protein
LVRFPTKQGLLAIRAAEVAALLGCHADKLTDDGRQRLVRHGHLPEREIMTGIGPVAVRCPRVRDRVGEGGEHIRFSSTILPPYARRSKSLEVLIPILYLKGISTGDFEEALIALLGKDAGGLSASTIGRLKEAWSDEHTRWSKRDLSAKRYVYFWVDGIHVQARLEETAQCLLVIIGATPEGKKELVGLIDGVGESAERAPPRPQTAGACDGTRARGRRRRPRLLAGHAASAVGCTRPPMS